MYRSLQFVNEAAKKYLKNKNLSSKKISDSFTAVLKPITHFKPDPEYVTQFLNNLKAIRNSITEDKLSDFFSMFTMFICGFFSKSARGVMFFAPQDDDQDDNEGIKILDKYIEKNQSNYKCAQIQKDGFNTITIFTKYTNSFYQSSDKVIVLKNHYIDNFPLEHFFKDFFNGSLVLTSKTQGGLRSKMSVVKKYIQFIECILNKKPFSNSRDDRIKTKKYFIKKDKSCKSNEKFYELSKSLKDANIDIAKFIYYCDNLQVTKGTLFLVVTKNREKALKKQLESINKDYIDPFVYFKHVSIIQNIKNSNSIDINTGLEVERYQCFMNAYIMYLESKEELCNIFYKILMFNKKSTASDLFTPFGNMISTLKLIFNFKLKSQDIKEFGNDILDLLRSMSSNLKNLKTTEDLSSSKINDTFKKIYEKITDIIKSNNAEYSNTQILKIIDSAAEDKINVVTNYEGKSGVLKKQPMGISIAPKEINSNSQLYDTSTKLPFSFLSLFRKIGSNVVKYKAGSNITKCKPEDMKKKIELYIENINEKFALCFDIIDEENPSEESSVDYDIEPYLNAQRKKSIYDIEENSSEESSEESSNYDIEPYLNTQIEEELGISENIIHNLL